MPAGISDGALIVDTGLNNAGFFRDARQFKRAVESLKTTVDRVGRDMGKSGSAYMQAVRTNVQANRKFQQELRETEAEAKRLKATMDEMGGKRLATDALQQNRREVAKLTKQWEALRDKRDQAMLMDNSKGVSAYAIQMDQVMEKVRQLRVEREKLIEGGNAFVSGKDTETYRQMAEQYNDTASRLRQLRQIQDEVGGGFRVVMRNAASATASVARIAGHGALSFLKKLAAGARNAAIQLAKLAGRAVASGLKKIAQYAGGAARSLLHLGRSARQSGAGFQFSLKNLLRYGLGIRSMFVLFNKLRSAITDGFKTMSASDPRLRASLNSLMASLNGLKGSLAGAFAPILTAAAPALTTLINLLTQAVNAVGMFMAAITGQGYYMAAKGISAVGSAASGASGSVKDLKRQLAGFDELNILSANSGSGGGGAGSSADYAYAQMPIARSIADFVTQMKALVSAEDWDGLGHLLADKVNGVFDKARKLISWDNLGDRITQIMGGITGTINGLVDGVDWKSIGATFAEGLNTIINTALLWYRGLDWGDLGRGLANSLNGLISRFNWKHFGDLIQAKINALFDFTKNFLITFDEIEAAKKIREALGRIDLKKIASDFWETAKLAFNKAGNFLKVLLGGDVYDVQGDAVEQMWERGSGDASSTTYAESWAHRLAQTVGEALGNIPWPSILEEAKKLFLNAFDGLLDGLFNSENGEVVLKIVGAIAGVKFGPKILAALLGGGSGTGVTGVTAGANSLLSSITKVLDGGLSNISSALFVSQELFNHRIKQEDLDEIEKAAEEIKATLKKDEASGAKLAETVSDFVKNGGDERGWARLFSGQQFTTGSKLPSPYELAKKGYYDGGFFPNTIQLDPHYWDDNTDALESNTKAVNGQTKLVKNPTSPEAAHTPASQTAGLSIKAEMDLKRDWQGALNGIGDTSINASVNFLPAGMAGYLNKPLEYLKKVFAPGTDAQTRVELIRKGWTTLTHWVGTDGPLSAMVGLLKHGWSTLSSFVGTNNPISALISLAKKGWSNISDFVGTSVRVLTQLAKLNWSSIGDFVGEDVTVWTQLAKWNWSSITSYVGDWVTTYVSLRKSGWSSIADYVGTQVTTKVTLVVDKVNKISATVAKALGLASGGIITAGGRVMRFANGGTIMNSGRASWWSGVQKYATGTRNAHGTLFVAGESGPEIAGHINGRTEILNKSQLAQTMQAAVYNGMVAALRGITFTIPAVAAGGVMPYEVSAQIARSTADLQGTLDANNEDLIQTIISVAGQIVAAIQAQERNARGQASSNSASAQQVIEEINRRTQMFAVSPLKGML